MRLTVLAPADAIECAAMSPGDRGERPVYLRLARDAGPDVFDESYRFEPGRVRLVREGRDVLLVSTGTQTTRCLDAAGLLDARGISAGVLHVPSLKPVDAEALVDAARAAWLVVSVEEHTVLGGLRVGGRDPRARESAAWARVGIDDSWGESAPNDFLLEKHGLSPARVAERVARELAAETR
jgi:transketolase